MENQGGGSRHLFDYALTDEEAKLSLKFKPNSVEEKMDYARRGKHFRDKKKTHFQVSSRKSPSPFKGALFLQKWQ